MLTGGAQYADAEARYLLPAMDTMGQRIKTLRLAKGLTHQSLADAVGVTRAAVYQWEDGTTASIKLPIFLRLCDILGTDPQYLVWGPDRTDPSSPTDATGRHARPNIRRR
jgi:transcriptional regulator with XRE-family HTH domain